MDASSETSANVAGALGIIFFLLLTKNFVLMLWMAALRGQSKAAKAPEDNAAYGNMEATTVTNAADDFSTKGRINKALSNDAEYTPYFLILCIVIGGFVPTNRVQRLVIYGTLYVFARYLHSISYIAGISRGRVVGFLISFVVIFAMAMDILIVTQKNATYNQ